MYASHDDADEDVGSVEGGDDGALEDEDEAIGVVLVGTADTLAKETAHDARRDLREKMFMASKKIMPRVVPTRKIEFACSRFWTFQANRQRCPPKKDIHNTAQHAH